MTRICFILLSVLALALANGEAWAQAWPTRPIRAIVAFSAGGIVDVMARVVCDQLSSQLRQPVIVENRGGAGTTIGTAFVAKSDPDGYTILVNSSAHTISPLLQPNLTFDRFAVSGLKDCWRSCCCRQSQAGLVQFCLGGCRERSPYERGTLLGQYRDRGRSCAL